MPIPRDLPFSQLVSPSPTPAYGSTPAPRDAGTLHVSAVSIKRVMERVDLCGAQIYKLMLQSKFPKPIKVGTKSLWLTDELDLWLEAQRSARDTATVSS